MGFLFVSLKKLKYQSLTYEVPLYHFGKLHFYHDCICGVDTDQR